MENAIKYIIEFLLGEENKNLSKYISYGEDEKAKVIIKKSNFFDENIYLSKQSLPNLPLKKLNGKPILFGEAKVEEGNNQIIIYADLIASTFFLISRYEESVSCEVRDEHGRFIGKESLPYRAGFMDRPIVDEYGKLLRKWLKEIGLSVVEEKEGFNHIYLTHDVDSIWTWDNYCRALRTTAKRIAKNQKDKFQPLKAVNNYKEYDPIFTFKDIVEFDNLVKNKYGSSKCTAIYFFKGESEKKCAQDSAYWGSKFKERPKELIEYLIDKEARIGLHGSYASSLDTVQLLKEKKQIEEKANIEIAFQRNHYLASREPEDFLELIKIGITDDFTMGYADVLGFRLGTSKAVKWINPINREVTTLMLHNLTIMECTLDAIKYMNIQSENEAFEISKNIIDQVYKHNGELALLWHNPEFSKNKKSYQRVLYERLLEYINNKIKS